MITTNQFKTLDDLYRHYNTVLFSGDLPECIISISRGTSPSTAGYFGYKRWKAEDKVIHEICLTPYGLSYPLKEWHATLVHEMCHLWQYEFGSPSRPGYHNKQWADKMEAVGLMPSNTGKPGGRKVGQSMWDYPIEGGPFEKFFDRIDKGNIEDLRLKYLPAIAPAGATIVINTEEEVPEGEEPSPEQGSRSGKRKKYTCGCGNNVWGKGGLQLRCMECDDKFKEL